MSAVTYPVPNPGMGRDSPIDIGVLEFLHGSSVFWAIYYKSLA